MSKPTIIRVESDADCFISFGTQEKPPAASREQSMMIAAGVPQYIAVADDSGWWKRLFRHTRVMSPFD